jgi:hypothetical protein
VVLELHVLLDPVARFLPRPLLEHTEAWGRARSPISSEFHHASLASSRGTTVPCHQTE